MEQQDLTRKSYYTNSYGFLFLIQTEYNKDTKTFSTVSASPRREISFNNEYTIDTQGIKGYAYCNLKLDVFNLQYGQILAIKRCLSQIHGKFKTIFKKHLKTISNINENCKINLDSKLIKLFEKSQKEISSK